MGLFDIPTRNNKANDTLIAKRSNSPKRTATATVKGGGGLFDKINMIKSMVDNNLGQYKDEYIVIQNEDDLIEYINDCIENKVVAIDTETTGLDPISDDIVGICLYTPNQKAAYVPINHKSYITNTRAENQLSESDVGLQMRRISGAEIDVIMFNAPFDIRFIKNHLGVDIVCTWDCYLAARLMNENEGSGNNNLKALHRKYVLNGEGDAFKFDDLFKGVSFDLIPINTAYLYAAHDAIITYGLYEFQKKYLYYDSEVTPDSRNGMNGVSWVFFNIEMPCVKVVAEIENTGVAFDLDYADKLHEKYHKELEIKTNAVYNILEQYADDIRQYKIEHFNHKLSDPLNIDSPTQVAILLYDILKIPPVDEKTPRGTGEAILKKIDSEFTRALLEYREVEKLITTYIDKLPDCVNKNDGRIHCKFNQYGADTGRFSSQDPNLQNIPSHNKDIRKMFKATDGYVLMSSDYSQQEPKVMAQLCGDKKMLQAYREGKDLYAEIASLSFNKPYEDCLEFNSDGSTNPEGKSRRTQAKSILLGVLYGRGVPSIAEQLGTTPEKAQKIKDSVFKGFPAIEQFEQDSIHMAEELGYVTTLWGRKRRLPAMMLPDYEVEWKDGVAPDIDPLSFNNDVDTLEVLESVQRKWIKRIKSVPYRDKWKVFEQANKEGLWIIDNTKNKDTTKVVNARIQGSAADMSKLAMIKVGNDERLKELGFRLLIPIHDELIAECPEENVKECKERFAYLMSVAAQSKLTIPISCDVDVMKNWYGERITI